MKEKTAADWAKEIEHMINLRPGEVRTVDNRTLEAPYGDETVENLGGPDELLGYGDEIEGGEW